ncbi:MAG: nucleotidyl transferase AbiEii/AbiGii toxin family protein [Bacteroidaceae bacterium]|nr:nucleotidyl transferase AbiEii/AbiGii toxin family protein [Bacteroidaceae bacterium]
MLHKETVEPGTLELLKSLQSELELKDFNLVGGTALALQIGHRKSVDLDLFTDKEFDLEELTDMLVKNYDMKVSYARKQTLKGFIGNVMIDCIRYDYPHIESAQTIEGVRMDSVPDIIAMKLSAIAHNGTRVKDYIDIACLSNQYALEDMLGFYMRKYSNANIMMPTKALTYFNEINFDESVIMVKGGFCWEKVANRLVEMTLMPQKIFKDMVF